MALTPTRKAKLAANTFTGLQEFSGTTHAGIKLISLTTAQRDALTAANGMLIYNTTTATVQKYEAGAWADVGAGGGAPSAHATSHQNGGSDEISVAGLSGLLADAQTPTTHAASHASGGSDAVTLAQSQVTNLTTDLAAKASTTHAATHANGSSDPVKLDDLATPDDNTDLNASTTRHGLLLKLNNVSTDFLNGQGAWAAPAGGGGLTNWTESGPTYGGDEFAKFVPSSATADVSVIVQPKGTGAIQAQLSDGTATGGDNRGDYAVDFQTARAVTTQVASGLESVVAGGYANKASGGNSTVSGGAGNSATGNWSTSPGGRTNLASGDYSFAFGWESVSDKHAQSALAAGKFTAAGDAQSSVMTARISTANATPTSLSLDGATGKVTLSNNTTWAFKILVVARRTDADGENDAWEITGLIHRDANAASTTLDASQINQIGATAWTCAVSADTTNGALQIDVTGAASKTIQWVARIETTETTG